MTLQKFHHPIGSLGTLPLLDSLQFEGQDVGQRSAPSSPQLLCVRNATLKQVQTLRCQPRTTLDTRTTLDILHLQVTQIQCRRCEAKHKSKKGMGGLQGAVTFLHYHASALRPGYCLDVRILCSAILPGPQCPLQKVHCQHTSEFGRPPSRKL